MSEIRSRRATDAYREGWSRTFERLSRPAAVPDATPRICAYCDQEVPPQDWTCFVCWPEHRPE